ncbi:MAG TPA: hypothetical protein VNV63_01815, partial [Nitrospiria bacterium]|nr:hypothetical protein [Nitrospiria bacterium]
YEPSRLRPFGFTGGLAIMKKTETGRSTFAVISLWGKFGGLHTCGATFRYIVALQNIFLTRLFSKLRLKRKDFQEILRLSWAQEASGSNPDAPTKLFSESPSGIIFGNTSM